MEVQAKPPPYRNYYKPIISAEFFKQEGFLNSILSQNSDANPIERLIWMPPDPVCCGSYL